MASTVETSPEKQLAGSPHLLNLLLVVTTALSAWLLFQVQPMAAKRILPWYGGGTAVWTTAMLFFQSSLFFGYLYAHLTVRGLTPILQTRLHVGLLGAAGLLAAIVGVLPGEEWRPVDGDQPTFHILLMLAASVGLPFFMLAATAPLIQVWFARANSGRSPYRLYALSNAGSLAALLSYPLAVEPRFGVATQGAIWTSLFVLFTLICAMSGVGSLRFGRQANHLTGARKLTAQSSSSSSDADRSIRSVDRLLWVALPAVASVALLAITTHLCQDVLSAPLLWIAPMVVYLSSFILTFDSDRWYRRDVWLPIGGVASFAASAIWFRQPPASFGVHVGVCLTLLAAVCMVCHGELVRRRPAVTGLTSFYLSISAGGALGGILVGVVAPLALPDHFELQLSILAAWLLALCCLTTDRSSPFYDGGKGLRFAGLIGMVVLFVSLGVAMYAKVARMQAGVVDQRRNFYGVLKVRHIIAKTGDEYLDLTNGRISHGAQLLAEVHRRVPMWYYHADSGIGQVLAENNKMRPQRRVGVVGLGAGAIAAYAEKGETFRFYEINPQVFDVAEEHFSYLVDARQRGAAIELVEGDARISLEQEPPQNFDVLILDAFNSDAIPAHLLTLESFATYLRHLKPRGILAVHVTSEHVDLKPVLEAAARRYGLTARAIHVPPDDTPVTAVSDWIIMQRASGSDAQRDKSSGDGRLGPRSVEWTDDYSSLLDVLE
jgi:hypothetical protein